MHYSKSLSLVLGCAGGHTALTVSSEYVNVLELQCTGVLGRDVLRHAGFLLQVKSQNGRNTHSLTHTLSERACDYLCDLLQVSFIRVFVRR